jgi:hypothetical protein
MAIVAILHGSVTKFEQPAIFRDWHTVFNKKINLLYCLQWLYESSIILVLLFWTAFALFL